MKGTKGSAGASVIVGPFVILVMAGGMVVYLLGYMIFFEATGMAWRSACFAFMPLGAILLYLYWNMVMLLADKMDEFGVFGGDE